MNKQALILGMIMLVLGGIAGAVGGMWYSKEQFGKELLRYVHQDSVQQLRSYEKAKQLLESGEITSAIRLIDSQIEVARLASESAEEALSSKELSVSSGQ